jgi:hypothetical protein
MILQYCLAVSNRGLCLQADVTGPCGFTGADAGARPEVSTRLPYRQPSENGLGTGGNPSCPGSAQTLTSCTLVS